MRRLLIILILTGLVAVGLVTLIEHDPGYVLISYGHTTIETSVWLGLILLVSLFVAFHFLLRAWRRAMSSRGYFSSWSDARNARLSHQRTGSGYINFAEGNWARSRRQLLAGARHSAVPLLNYLVAAQASDRLGEIDQTRELLHQAESSDSKAAVAVELTRAQLQVDGGRLEDALATLLHVREKASRHPRVLELLMQVHQGLGDWQSLGELLPQLKKHKIIDAQRMQELAVLAGTHSLEATAGIPEAGARLGRLRSAWKALSEEQRRNERLIATYSRLLLAIGENAEVEKLLTKQLKKSWSDELVRLYGLTCGEDVYKQLIIAEAWLRDRPNNGELLLCTGRLALRNQLWGKAREYFQSSYKLLQTPETCAELGRLLAALGEQAQSNGYFQRGLLLSEQGLPELPLPQK